jgi:hypothetical protein
MECFVASWIFARSIETGCPSISIRLLSLLSLIRLPKCLASFL